MLDRALALAVVVCLLLGAGLLLKDDGGLSSSPDAPAERTWRFPDAAPPAPVPAAPPPEAREEDGDEDDDDEDEREDREKGKDKRKGGKGKGRGG